MLTRILILMTILVGLVVLLPVSKADEGDEGDEKVSEKEVKERDRQRDKFFIEQRLAGVDQLPSDWRIKAFNQIKDRRIATKAATTTTIEPPVELGPLGINISSTNIFSGRTNDVVSDAKDPATVYIAAAGGGVWKSTNAGDSWRCLTNDLPVQATGAIAIDPNNSNTVYVGTGDALLAFTSFSGIGVLKSTDAGETWKILAADTFSGMGFMDIIIDPTNSNIIYATAGVSTNGVNRSFTDKKINGVFKSTDAGVTWANILPSTELLSGRADLAMDPNNSNNLYVIMPTVGFFRTKDGGKTWKRVADLPGANAWLGAVTIASDNKTIYAAADVSTFTAAKVAVYRSTNKGKSFKKVTSPNNGNSAFTMEVNPRNPRELFLGGVLLYRSQDGGLSWSKPYSVHADAGRIHFTSNPNIIYEVNDGGVYLSNNAGESFSNRNTNLSLTQFYNIAIHPTNPNIALGGTQDNSNVLYSGKSQWKFFSGGDGGFTAIDQSDPTNMLGFTPIAFIQGSKNPLQPAIARIRRNLFVTETVGVFDEGVAPAERGLFYPPLAVDPNSQSTLYYGGRRLYRSTERGNNWQPLGDMLSSDFFSAVTVAPSNSEVIYLGTFRGNFISSTDSGKTFQNLAGGLPTRYITDIAVDPDKAQTVYATVSGFHTGHIFKSEDGGKSWIDISGNLPDIPANTLILNPFNAGNIFVGTDLGLFSSEDGGKNWLFVEGMPIVPVFDLAANKSVGLFIATHGRGIYRAKFRS